MTTEEKLSEYLKLIKDTVLSTLQAGDYQGNLTFQFNIKNNQVSNMNIGGWSSVRVQ